MRLEQSNRIRDRNLERGRRGVSFVFLRLRGEARKRERESGEIEEERESSERSRKREQYFFLFYFYGIYFVLVDFFLSFFWMTESLNKKTKFLLKK